MNPTTRFTSFFWSCLIASLLFSCQSTPPTPMNLEDESIIPLPLELSATGSSFELTENTQIHWQKKSASLEKVATYLAEILRPATGLPLEIKAQEAQSGAGHISLNLTQNTDLGAEGYQLAITEQNILLEASSPAGVFYAVQTLRQLLPANIEKSSKQEGPWRVATGSIKDIPVYAYRGAMLDVARHFFGPDDVKRYIDLIAMYKMNTLHLHLSDDQGWRIEIKSWPKLASYGGSTEVGGGEGGFYTQETYQDLVQYAADQFITIIPEIDMPGHTQAALASYPELACGNKEQKLYTGTEVGFSTLCTSKDVTYEFVDDVVKELAAITPGPYIHIGGDESHVTPMKDYIPFVNKVQEIVKKHGKQVIGWDEIANGTLLPNTVVQYWAEAENAEKAIAQGAKVLMSPATKTYLDMQYDSTTKLGLHWAAYIEVDAAYNWDMETIEESIAQEDIIGIEAPLWSETVTNMDEIEYMIFPRLPGHAEIGWTPTANRNWESYKKRLGKHGERFKALDIDYYPSALVSWNE